MTEQTFLQNKLLPAACETYSCVQKKVCRFILKVQASVSLKKEHHQLTSEHSEDSSSRRSSERVSVSSTKAVKANVSSTSAQGEEEQLHLDTCTEEIIAKILDLYRTQGQKQTSDLFQSTCTHLVCDVLVRNIQILAKRQKLRKTERSVCYRKLSRNLIRYLESAAWEIMHSVSRELEECLKAGSRNKTQTGLSRASNMSAFDHANIFAPFRLFGHVRNDVENIFSTVKEGRWPNKRAKMITQDSVFDRSSSHHGCLSRGFAGRLAGNKNSAVNQLKSLLSSDSSTGCHEPIIANAVSAILRNMTASNITRTFSQEERSRGRVFGARAISLLVHGFVPELLTHLDCYFSSTEFTQLAAQTEFCKGEVTANDEKAFTAAVRELTKSLTDFVVESSATPTRRPRNSKTLDELNAHSQERQLTSLDEEVSHSSARGSAGKKKKEKEKKKSETSEIESCSSAQQEVYFWDDLSGEFLRETIYI
ncbi:uncharacterized protein LOC131348093 [Hemibagrus wyckioides]|uniref:uncharacterized protein LOC131348093 n=1 Tax=Hemibagrus wyckioides TaxID=337641 RepID=UPI00266D5DE4|nr:uncharacterized protein LOC131348093 [Hemibagrus wyckioides]